jgi:hypothetical protein
VGLAKKIRGVLPFFKAIRGPTSSFLKRGAESPEAKKAKKPFYEAGGRTTRPAEDGDKRRN